MKPRMIWTNNRRKVTLEVDNRHQSNIFYEDCDVRIASISRIACLAWNITGESFGYLCTLPLGGAKAHLGQTNQG